MSNHFLELEIVLRVEAQFRVIIRSNGIASLGYYGRRLG